jgi:DNA-binding protein Fis
MSEQKVETLQVLKALEELMDKYLSEGSVEKALALYYIVMSGHDYARLYIMLKFGSLKPYTLVLEDMQKANVSSIPDEVKKLMDVKKVALRQLLINDALNVIDKLDPMVKKIVATALLMFEHGESLSGGIDEVFKIYQILTGERIPDEVKEELSRYLYRLHLVELRGYYLGRGSYEWSPNAPYILKALKNKIPKIIIEFRSEQEKKQ